MCARVQVFERLAAPIYMPDRVQRQRPDLVDKYGDGTKPAAKRPKTTRQSKGRQTTRGVAAGGDGGETPAQVRWAPPVLRILLSYS